MTYVNIKQKDLKELLSGMLLDIGTDKETRKKLWYHIISLFECIEIEDARWEETMEWLDTYVYPRLFEMKGKKTTSPKSRDVNFKKAVGKIPNFNKNLKRITF